MTVLTRFAIATGMMILMGCGSSVISVRRPSLVSREVVLVAKGGQRFEVGRVYAVIRSEVVHASSETAHGGHAGHTHGSGSTHVVRKVMGQVRVVEVPDDKHARAEIIGGEVRDGDFIEP